MMKTLKYKIRNFFTGMLNFWRFRKEIYNFRSWDAPWYCMDLFLKGLELTADYAEKHSYQVRGEEKAVEMRKFIEWYKNHEEIEYLTPGYDKALENTNMVFNKDRTIKFEYINHTKEDHNKLFKEHIKNEEEHWKKTMDFLKEKLREWWD